jgi:hypothetical protein
MSELIGVKEVAELAGVTSAAVANWRTRHADFPRPVEEMSSWSRAATTAANCATPAACASGSARPSERAYARS